MKKINPEDFIPDEMKFCKDRFKNNNHNQYIYTSTDGTDSFNLPFILSEYRDWLIENNLMRNKDGNEL